MNPLMPAALSGSFRQPLPGGTVLRTLRAFQNVLYVFGLVYFACDLGTPCVWGQQLPVSRTTQMAMRPGETGPVLPSPSSTSKEPEGRDPGAVELVSANQKYVDPLMVQLDRAIDVTSQRFLTANVHSPWQIFHGVLALRRDFQLKLGNGKINAIEWISTAEPKFDNLPLLIKTQHSAKFHPFTRKYAFEGHPAQFMALLTASDLPVNHTFKVGNETVTLADMLYNIMKEVNSREEVTWVLWTLQHYIRPDAQWTNQENEAWSIERLVQIETKAPVVGAPCGGNHRLFALTRSRDKYLKAGGQLRGIWAEADYKVRQHIELARTLQNTDGSFSSKSYAGPGYSNDLNERFNTSGHTMEFLSVSLPDQRLNEPWVRNAIAVLTRDLIQNPSREIDCGPLYHTLNSLINYRDRIRGLNGSTDIVATNPLTKQPSSGTGTVKPPEVANNDRKVPTNPQAAQVSPKTTPQVTAPMPPKENEPGVVTLPKLSNKPDSMPQAADGKTANPALPTVVPDQETPRNTTELPSLTPLPDLKTEQTGPKLGATNRPSTAPRPKSEPIRPGSPLLSQSNRNRFGPKPQELPTSEGPLLKAPKSDGAPPGLLPDEDEPPKKESDPKQPTPTKPTTEPMPLTIDTTPPLVLPPASGDSSDENQPADASPDKSATTSDKDNGEPKNAMSPQVKAMLVSRLKSQSTTPSDGPRLTGPLLTKPAGETTATSGRKPAPQKPIIDELLEIPGPNISELTLPDDDSEPASALSPVNVPILITVPGSTLPPY